MNSTEIFRSPRSILVAGVFALALAACGDKPAEPKSESVAVKPAPQTAPPPAPTRNKGLDQPQPASGAMTASSTTPAPAAAPDPNKALAARVKSALEAEPRVNGQGIDVTAEEGVVSLWGTVADAGERRKAEQVAASQPGVKSVQNRLVVVKGS